MADEKEKLSPEEKLLKVIQSGGEVPKKPDPVPAPVAAPAPAAARPVPVAAAEPPAPPRKPVIPVKAPAGDAAGPRTDAPKLKLTKNPVQDKERAVKAAAFAKAMAESAAPAAVDPAAAAPATAPAPKAKEPLRVKAQEVSARPAAAKAAPVKTVAAVSNRRKPREGRSFLPVFNRAMVAGIFVAIGLSGYEIWAGIRWETGLGGPLKGPDGVSLSPIDLPPDPYMLNEVLDQYEKRPLLGLFVSSLPLTGTTTTVRVIEVAVTDLEKEVRDNLQLIGLSKSSDGQSEAIIMDKKESRMHLLKIQDRLTVLKDKELTVGEILNDRVILKSGEISLVVK